jgi:hypothetical protein
MGSVPARLPAALGARPVPSAASYAEASRFIACSMTIIMRIIEPWPIDTELGIIVVPDRLG